MNKIKLFPKHKRHQSTKQIENYDHQHNASYKSLEIIFFLFFNSNFKKSCASNPNHHNLQGSRG